MHLFRGIRQLGVDTSAHISHIHQSMLQLRPLKIGFLLQVLKFHSIPVNDCFESLNLFVICFRGCLQGVDVVINRSDR